MGTGLFSRAGVLGLGFFGVIACGDSAPTAEGPPSAPAPTSTTPGSTEPSRTTPPDTTPPSSSPCATGASVCRGYNQRMACNAGKWVEETCASGSGCYKGACVVGKCSDECVEGTISNGKKCVPWSIATDKPATSAPADKLHDRARGFYVWMEKASMVTGAIGSAHFSDPPAYTTIDRMDGIGDSAIWTGAYLGAESFRLRATGSSDARMRVRSLAETVHLLLVAAGEPGILMRWVKPSSKSFPFEIGDYDCSIERVHCNVDYKGTKYDLIGHVSRDQYQGVMFGLVNAYDALGAADEDIREMIRADIVTIVKELMKERTLSVNLTFNGVKVPTSTVTARFIVVSPREMKNGAIDLRVDLGKPDDSEMYGFQEFYPNLAHLVRQLPGLSWVPDIPRASSAIMLTSFFRAALHVTKDVPAYAKDRADILAYYTSSKTSGGNVNDWLLVAKKWSDGGKCGNGYYANNITMMPMYNLARLEDDPARSLVIKKEILEDKMWPAFEKTKNVFFSYVYAGVVTAPKAGTTKSAGDQIAQFPIAPRINRPVDLRQSPKYTSRENGCADQVGHHEAVDVGDRVTADFMWQRHPWGLYDGGDPGQTQPGIDYLLAYFMGQHHGFLDDDTPGTCLALK